MSRILFYCQHSLGMGHLVRSTAIAQALAREFELTFLDGGELAPDFRRPVDFRTVHLAPLFTDAEFREIRAVDAATPVEEIKHQRTRTILDTFDSFQPDVLIVELFPFGRRKFRFEIVPLLDRAKSNGTAIVCSLRDILVQKTDQARFETQVVELVNTYFDLVLVHADPTYQTLGETFGAVNQIRCPVVYTGFVAPESAGTPQMALPRREAGPLIVTSVGGGRVGFELLYASVEASALLHAERAHAMAVFTGPYSDPERDQELRRLAAAHPHIAIQRYTPDLKLLLDQAELSVSMAGYNTCMDIVSSRVPALVYPFTGNGNDEQVRRAEKLSDLQVLRVLNSIEPRELQREMRELLDQGRIERQVRLDLGGAIHTKDAITELLANRTIAARSVATGRRTDDIAEALEALERSGRTVDVFFRDDDFDHDNPEIRQLIDLFGEEAVPLSLAVIPGTLTDEGASLLRNTRAMGARLEVHQHGFRHRNHETAGRKSEFGSARSHAQQLEDIAAGQSILRERFEDTVIPAFTPPWNRCDASCERALDELGFSILSRDLSHVRAAGRRFTEIPVTLDVFAWKSGPALRTDQAVIGDLCNQLGMRDTIGILLHHKVMDARAHRLIRHVIRSISKSGFVRLNTLGTIGTQSPALRKYVVAP